MIPEFKKVIELINKIFDDFRETTSVKNTIAMLDIVQRVLIRSINELEIKENEIR